MAIQRQDEQMSDEGRRQTAVADRPVTGNDGEGRVVAEDQPVARDDSVVEKQVVYSSAGALDVVRGWVRSLGGGIMVALAVVETLLVFRLGFLLAEANPSNGFVNFIYDVSQPLAKPFQGIVSSSGNLDYASAIAMGVYAVAALLLIAALFALTAGPSTASEKVVSSRTQTSGRVR